MLTVLRVRITLCFLALMAFAFGVPQQANLISAPAVAASTIECDSSSDPCVRVYKTLKDIESQSYKVVKFTEVEARKALVDGNARLIHDRIKDETGFDCKSGKPESYGYRCEEGVLATRYQDLIECFRMLYGA